MSIKRMAALLVGLAVALLSWILGFAGPLALVLGLVVAAVLLVTLTRPAGVLSRGTDNEMERADAYGWGSPLTNMLLWSGVAFGWVNGTGGAGPDGADQLDGMTGGLDGGFDAGGFDAGGFDGGGGGSE